MPSLPDHFEGEDVIITLEKEFITGDSTTRTLGIKNVEGKVLSWNISGGDATTEDVFAFGGKTFNFSKPRNKFTVNFDIMLNNSDFDFVQFGAEETLNKNAAAGAIGYDSGNSRDYMSGIVVTSTDKQRRWRVIMWFQDSSYHVANSGRTIVVPSQTQPIYRMIFVDVKSVTFDKTFSADEYMKGTLSLEFSAADEKGYPNFIQEEGVHTATTSGPRAIHQLTDNTTSGIQLEARGYMDWNATTTPYWYAGSTTTDTTVRYRYSG